MTDNQFDQIEKLPCGALIQHGLSNDRIYLMKTGNSPENLPENLLAKTKEAGYSKIFVKVRENHAAPFIEMGFIEEAVIPGFFNGRQSAVFMGYYSDKKRSICVNREELDKILELAKNKAKSPKKSKKAPDDFTLRLCTKNDITQMVKLYKMIFPSYPFPIHDPAYLRETMDSHVDYYAVENEGSVVALSSCEKDLDNANAEMTDFATHTDYLGNGLAALLLRRMETDAPAKGIKTAYTIARAVSPGMNITFAVCGYEYCGRLINNTNISGGVESMNVWYKPLS